MKSLRIVLGLCTLVFFSTVLFSSCKQQRDIQIRLTVKYIGDTNYIVPFAKVHMHKDDVDIKGYTDQYGRFIQSFTAKQSLNVDVEKDTTNGSGAVCTGNIIVHMRDYGTVQEKTIFIGN